MPQNRDMNIKKKQLRIAVAHHDLPQKRVVVAEKTDKQLRNGLSRRGLQLVERHAHDCWIWHLCKLPITKLLVVLNFEPIDPLDIGLALICQETNLCEFLFVPLVHLSDGSKDLEPWTDLNAWIV